MDSPPLPVPVGSPPCTMKSYSTNHTSLSKNISLKHRVGTHIHEIEPHQCKNILSKQGQERTEHNHLNDPVEFNVVVVTSARQFNEVPASSGRMLVVQLNTKLQ